VRQKLPGLVDERPVPHGFVVRIGRREHNGYQRHDHQNREATAGSFSARVFAETDVGHNRHEGRANKMAGPAYREHEEGTRQHLHGTANHPETDHDKQHTDRQAADLALRRNQSDAQQRETRGAEDQQY
jgi:hypothetical protein